MNESYRARMQRQIAGFPAFAGHLKMRHAVAFVPGVFDFEGHVLDHPLT